MRRPSQCGVGQGGTNSTQLEQITAQERKLCGVANKYPFLPVTHHHEPDSRYL